MNRFLSILILTATVSAQLFDPMASMLRKGGYVIVMRHASSPREVPDRQAANPDNPKPERQLDAEGRRTAAAMGKALRDLKIPIGEVLTSPTYRALETVRLEGWPNSKPFPELGDNGQSMQSTGDQQAAWLRKIVTEFPSGTNTVIVTHLPNLTAAFPEAAAGMKDGEALIFAPDGKGGAKVIAHIGIEDWSKLKN